MSSLPLPAAEGAFLLKVLRDFEEDLVQWGCEQDMVELSKKFSQSCVISSEGFDRFSSLEHDRLKPQLQVRYLLRLVRERAKTDQMVLEKLVALLEILRAPSSFTDKLKGLLDSSCGASDRDSDLAQDSIVEAMEEDNIDEMIVLTQQNISWLTEYLVRVSHKWELIAISLGLLQHERANCKNVDNIVALTNCLECWISKSSIPTLLKLKESLCSKTVGEMMTAKKIVEEFKLARNGGVKTHKQKSSSKSTILRKSSDIPSIVNMSLPSSVVADGKSTLLLVHVVPSESVLYKWEKDGRPLVNGHTYNGVDEDILFVNASQGAEGKYKCGVSRQGHQVCSDLISLTVLYPPAKKALLALYSQVSEIPLTRDDWPPVVSDSFINLALIKSDKRHTKRLDFSVRGDADDIISVKEKVTYDEVFGSYCTGELILVEGRPGSGKTVLVHKITKDWALGKVLSKASLTFLVTLRLFNSSELDQHLSEIIRDFFPNDSELQAVVEDIELHSGSGTCFVFDGLDEYSPSSKEKSVVFKLLNRKYLPRSMIIVSSRPSATGLVNEQLIGKRIEVFGFSKDQILEYIYNFPFYDLHDKSSVRADQLKHYLLSHPNIHDMCYLPIHAAMICFLFQHSDEMDSSTQTKIYEEFTQLIIYRHLVRQGFSQHLDSLKNLDPIHKKYFSDLCTLAFNMTVNSKQVISSKELPGYQLIGRGSPGEEHGLGLLTICPTLQKTGIHHTYSFLHLTLQEFLAACHMAGLDVSQQLCLLKQYSRQRHTKTMLLFYCGLVDFEEAPERLDHLSQGNINDSEQYRYAYESQQKRFCDKIFKKARFFHFTQILAPIDFLAIGYVIATSSEPFQTFDMRFHDYSDDRVTVLLQHLARGNLCQLKDLILKSSIKGKGVEYLHKILDAARNITYLEINLGHTSSCDSTKLVNGITKLLSLCHLRISYTGTPDSIRALLSGLSNIEAYQCLSLEELDEHCISALGNGRKEYNIKELDLKIYNSFKNESDWFCLVGGLYNVDRLKLDLSHNLLTSSGISGLCTSSLVALTLSHNNIGLDGAAALAGGFECMAKLERLDLSYNNIGPRGATTLAGGLHHLIQLKVLDLLENGVDLAGAMAVIISFKNSYSLQCLFISCSKYNKYPLRGSHSIFLGGLVSRNDNATISALVKAAQHKTRSTKLDLGFQTITIPSS